MPRVVHYRAGWLTLLATAIFSLGIGGYRAGGERIEQPSGSRVIQIAAAADLKFALEEIVRQFQTQHPDISARASYGSSGLFYSQILNQAPFDLFYSADLAYPKRLADLGFASEKSLFVYAVGSLVLWVSNSSSIDLDMLGMKALMLTTVHHVAIANPKHAPYGRAAEEALRASGIYEAIREKLVHGENVSQAMQFVQSGSAEIGILALSLALAPGVRGQGRFWKIPPDRYSRMEQGGVMLRWARDASATRLFREFVQGSQGRAIMARYGFGLPGE
jgi:molybdate transport system substrate-binding protein